MKQEDKELLLKDLCARLPYGVKFASFSQSMKNHSEPVTLRQIYYHNEYDANNIEGDNDISTIIEFVKPYLRPMSSMTEEEENEYRAINCYEGLFPRNEDALDYVLSHHFDYRGLIEKGLAIGTINGIYN